jgi:hypothetical protein
LTARLSVLEGKGRPSIDFVNGRPVFGGTLTAAEQNERAAIIAEQNRRRLAMRGGGGSGGGFAGGPFGVGSPGLDGLPGLGDKVGLSAGGAKRGKDFDWSALFPPEGAFNTALTGMDKYKASLDETSEAMRMFGEAGNLAFSALMSATASGATSIGAFSKAVLTALKREATGRAVFELASGFSALARSVLFGDPKAGAAAALHFKSAAMFGAFGAIAGALGGGGGAGGAGSPSSFRVDGRGEGSGERRPIQIIQVVAQDGRVISEQVMTESARISDRGTRVPGNAHRVRLDNVVVVAARGA